MAAADAVLVTEGLALAGLAVILAGPVPVALARAGWPARSPRAALVLWQAVGLGGGLAILGAGLTLAVSGLHRSWAGGLAALPGRVEPGRGAGLGPLGWAGASLTVAAGAWLAAVLAVSTARLVLARREHRVRLDLLADELPVGELLGTGGRGTPGGGTSPAAGGLAAGTGPVGDLPGPAGSLRVRLLDHRLATAYCLPGVRPRIVLSQGVIDALSQEQLAAVVAHERAHARGRHDLVIQPFRAWQQTFPFLAPAARALAAVELLVELVADDVGRRRCGQPPLTAALRRLADLAPADAQVTARAARLAAPPPPLPRLAATAVCAAAVALVCLPPAILLAS